MFAASGLYKKAGFTTQTWNFIIRENVLIKNEAASATIFNSDDFAIVYDLIRNQLISQRKSYSFETVFGHPSKLDLINFAHQNNSENESRTGKNRIIKGGHSVEEEKVKNRYFLTMNLLHDMVEKADEAYLWDNSGIKHQFVASIKNGFVNLTVPGWLNTYQLKGDRILMEQYYNYVLSVHIIFVVSWMAGLFYGVRLFIYHTEANDKPEPEKSILTREYSKITARLWNIITTPAMYLTIVAGIFMICIRPVYLQMDWLWVKLGFVILLLAYHFICQQLMVQLRNGVFKRTSNQLRLWNEVATILLVAIVFTVVLKSAVNWIYGLIGLVIFSAVIMIAVKLYKKHREKNKF